MSLQRSSITAATINQLKPSWSYDTVSYVTGQPLLWKDKVYCYDWAGYLYCLEEKSGKLCYKKQLYQPTQAKPIQKKIPLLKKYIGEPLPYMWNGFAGSGCISGSKLYLASVGSKPGRILENGASGVFYIVNLEDGTIIYQDKMTLSKYSGSISHIIEQDGIVYVGICSCDEIVAVVSKVLFKPFYPQGVGAVIAFDASTGKRVWAQNMIGLLPEDVRSAKGAGVWGGFAVDPQKQALFFGTGNNYGSPPSKSSDSVISLNSQTGELRWQYQAISGDAWLPTKKKQGPDFDFGSTPILFDCSVNKNAVKAVGLGNKNGYFYVFNSVDGTLLWKTNCNVNSTSDDGIRSKASYANGRIYVWSKNEKPKDTLTVCCLNANSGEVIWSHISDGTNAMSNGLLVNDLYFVPYYNGKIDALSLVDGQVLWTGEISKVSFGSSITLYRNRIIVGRGVPSLYGGNPDKSGLYTFTLS